MGLRYWYILNLKLPRFGKACKRNLIKFRKQKFRGTFKTRSNIENRAFTKIDNGIYSFRKIESHLRCLKKPSKMSSETDNKTFLCKVLK